MPTSRPLILALALAAALTSVGSCASAADGPVVKLAQGQLQGAAAGDVETFKGVPFAAPPVGELRWRPPVAAPAWTGVRPATDFGPICMQPAMFRFASMPMSEDCLTLNVWRPAGAKPGARLPVMVWIYGGAFIGGAGSLSYYDGTKFAEGGVILVTFNYRLGRFGFFAHPALDGGPGPVGNYGLMDQIAALKWVKANIASFGGDPAKVTIFGESAGAISVNFLMGSPAARGLFRAAIAESGFGRIKAFELKGARSAEQVGQLFADANGIKGEGADAAAALRALPADKVNAPYSGLSDPNAPSPILDGQIVKETIAEAFAAGREAHVPYLEGGNSYEASLFPDVGKYPDPVIARAGDPLKVEALYGKAEPAEVARELTTDTMITEPDRFLARQMAGQGLPAFVYHFAYVTAAQRAASFGAAHGSEIGYVFSTLPKEPISFGTRTFPAATLDDWKVSEAMHAYWLAFAKTGDPGAAGGPRWPRYEAAADDQMAFDQTGPHVITAFEKDRLDLIEAALRKGP